MLRYATAALLAVLATAPFVPAADKAEKAKRPAGAWTHTLNDMTVTFTFEDDTLRVDYGKTDGEAIRIDAAYGVTGDGLVFGVITKVDKKGTDAGPEKGDLFSFEAKIDKDVLTISNLTTSKGVSEEGKQLLQGEYTKKK